MATPGAFTARDHPLDRAARLNLLRARLDALEEAIGSIGGGGASISDAAYGPGWNGDTTAGASKNALYDKIETLAPLANPGFTGVPTAPTAAPGTNTTQLANTAFVAAAIAALVGTAPGILNTLGEISDAINDDANLYTTLVALIALKADKLLGIDTVAGAAYTFASADDLRHKRFTSAANVVATVPKNATDPIPIGARIRCTQAGLGFVTLTPEDGTVTLNSRDDLLTSTERFAVFEIEKVALNEWDCLGDLAP